MATKRKIHSKKKFTLPLAIVAGFVGGPVAATINQKNRYSGDWGRAILWEAGSLGGYDTENSVYAGIGQMKKAGYIPLAVGFGVHWMASKFGVNKMIARAGIPFIRI
jgi:hypothetical protein